MLHAKHLPTMTPFSAVCISSHNSINDWSIRHARYLNSWHGIYLPVIFTSQHNFTIMQQFVKLRSNSIFVAEQYKKKDIYDIFFGGGGIFYSLDVYLDVDVYKTLWSKSQYNQTVLVIFNKTDSLSSATHLKAWIRVT